MYILRIEHPVPDYDGWKKAFASRARSCPTPKRGSSRRWTPRPADSRGSSNVRWERDGL